MSLPVPYHFPFWVVAEQRQRGREVTVSLAILNLAELNSVDILCSSCFEIYYFKSCSFSFAILL